MAVHSPQSTVPSAPTPFWPFNFVLPDGAISVIQQAITDVWQRIVGSVAGANTTFSLTSTIGTVPGPSIIAGSVIIFADTTNPDNIYILADNAGATMPFVIPGGSYAFTAPGGKNFDVANLLMKTGSAGGTYKWSLVHM